METLSSARVAHTDRSRPLVAMTTKLPCLSRLIATDNDIFVVHTLEVSIFRWNDVGTSSRCWGQQPIML